MTPSKIITSGSADSTDVKVARVEVKVDLMKDQLAESGLQIRNLDAKTSALYSSLDTKIDALPEEFAKKFAAKQTERIVNAMIGLILVAFMTALIYIVIPKH